MGEYNGGIRVMLMPTIGIVHDVQKDSSYILMMRIGRELIAAGNYVYMVLPDGCQDSARKDDSGIFYLFSRSTLLYEHTSSFIDSNFVAEMFSPECGKYLIDAAVCMSAEHALQLSAIFTNRGGDGELPFPILFAEPGIAWHDSEPSYRSRFDKEVLQSTGTLLSYPVFFNHREKRMALEKARSVGFSPSMLKRIEAKCTVSAVPMQMDVLAEYAKRPKNDKFTCLFAARTNSVKRPDKIVEVFDEVFRAGYDIGVDYLTPTNDLKLGIYDQRHNLFGERGYITPIPSADTATFYDHAARSHLYMLWSTSEAYPMSTVEAILLGNIVMIHKCRWTKEVFTNVEDDLFWFQHKQDAIAKIMWMYENYDEARQRMEGVRQWYIDFLQNVKLSRHVEAVARRFVNGSDAYNYKGYEDVVCDILGFIGGGEEWGMHQFSAEMGMKARIWKPDQVKRAASKKAPSDWMLHGLFRTKHGFVDTCKSRHPKYRRSEGDGC